MSGKKQSGKNTAAKVVQWLIHKNRGSTVSLETFLTYDKARRERFTGWEEKSYAAKIKLHVADILNISTDLLEDEEFKNKELGEKWTRYAYATGFEDVEGERLMVSTTCSKEKYAEEQRSNRQTAYKMVHTPRTLLQMVGTNIGRIVHADYWVNGLMIDYKPIVDNAPLPTGSIYGGGMITLPNWIITDCRFPNEAEVTDGDTPKADGFVIRIKRKAGEHDNHISETALDNHKFKYVIHNNACIDNLADQLAVILTKEGIINKK